MRGYAIILAIFLLGAVILPCVSATSDSLKAIVVIENKVYNSGDVVDIAVHVFDKGVYVSADDVQVNVGTYPPQPVTVTETSTGVYSGQYTIQPTDIYLYIIAEVSKGTDSDTGIASIQVGEEAEEEELYVYVELDDPNDYYAEPGDAVEITVTVKEGGTNVDADSLDLKVNDVPLTYTPTGTGVYTATKNIPSTLTEGSEYSIDAEAVKGSVSWYGVESFYVLFYWVCYHNITKSATSSTFDLYVSDLDCKAVSGAVVNINYDDDGDENTPEATREGTTDGDGKTRLTITYTELSYIDIEGRIQYSGKSQDFDGTIWLELSGVTPEEPAEEGFDVIPAEGYLTYDPDDVVTRQYTAYYDGALWTSKDIHYYITEGFMPANAIVKSGSVVADADGKFTVTFTAPSETVWINFETGRPKTEEDDDYDQDDDLVYEEDMDYIPIGMTAGLYGDWDDENVSISVSELVLGGKTTVTVSTTNMPTDAELWAMCIIGCLDNLSDIAYGDMQLDWQCWAGMSSVLLSKTDGKYSGELSIPEFMPEDTDYTIIAGWTSEGDAPPHLNYLVLQPGEGGGTQPPTGADLGTLDPNGETASVKVGEGAKFTYKGEENSLIVNSVTSNSATLKLYSTSETLTLNVGETKEVDTDGNDKNDLAITLNSANTTAQTASMDIKPIAEKAEAEELDMMLILMIVVVIVIVVALIAVLMKGRGKK